MKRVIVTLVLLVPAQAIGVSGSVVTVVGQDNRTIDRQAVQDAVDAASGRTTIMLEGVFKFDGTPVFITKSDLTFAGIEVDDDRDGKVNEDWDDGIDNDEDGTVDEDGWNTVIKGIRQTELGAWPEGVGFVVAGMSGEIKNLVFEGLSFTGFARQAVVLAPGSVVGTCNRATAARANTRVTKVQVRRNLFQETRGGVYMHGPVTEVLVEDNVFQDASSSLYERRIEMGAEVFYAVSADGNARCGGLVRGPNERTRIRDNVFASRGHIFCGQPVVRVAYANKLNLSRNVIRGCVLIWVVTKAKVRANMITQGSITTYGVMDGTKITNNTFLRLSHYAAIVIGGYLGNRGRGITAKRNATTRTAFTYGTWTYALTEYTTDNTIVLMRGQTVLDEGKGNTIKGG